MSKSGNNNNKKNDKKFFYYDISEEDMKNSGLYYDDTATILDRNWDRKWAKQQREWDKRNAKSRWTSTKMGLTLAPIGAWACFMTSINLGLYTWKIGTTDFEPVSEQAVSQLSAPVTLGFIVMGASIVAFAYFGFKLVNWFLDSLMERKETYKNYRKFFKKKSKKRKS